MATRLELDARLRAIPGVEHVYFQPPENVRMQFPCIVYELADIHTRRADNKHYVKHKRYTVTYVTRNWDESMLDKILESFEMASFNRSFKSDNLYHFVYDLYF